MESSTSAEVNGTDYDISPESGRNEATTEFLHLLKEKRAIEAELVEKEKQLNQSQGKNYEYIQRIEELEKQLAESKEQLEQATKKKVEGLVTASPKPQRALRPKTAGKHPNSRMKPRKTVQSKSKVDVKKEEEKPPTPVKDTYTFYTEIAERFPLLRLSIVLVAEKKFMEADLNNDGTIDADELEKILETSQMMFTKQQVIDIVSEIDTDKSGNLDFMECLKVMDRLQLNKKTNLPTNLEKNRSQVCSIQ